MKRQCNECTLCCKLVPVNEGMTIDGRVVPSFVKPANTRCQHQRHGKGCAIYDKRPLSCAVWSCGWLSGNDTADMPRPDRCHYVIDPMPDNVEIGPKDDVIVLQVIQIWIDPKHSEAANDPALRRYLKRQMINNNMPALLRWGNDTGLFVFYHKETDTWVERQSNVNTDVMSLVQRLGARMSLLGEEAS